MKNQDQNPQRKQTEEKRDPRAPQKNPGQQQDRSSSDREQANKDRY